MSDTTQTETESDAVWGAEAIGKEINRTAQQVYYLFGIGALDGAVTKLGPKTYLASRRKLRTLPLSKIGK
jgi:beta-N-acetylglucosaminidase